MGALWIEVPNWRETWPYRTRDPAFKNHLRDRRDRADRAGGDGRTGQARVWDGVSGAHKRRVLGGAGSIGRCWRSTGIDTLFDYYRDVLAGVVVTERGDHAVF